MLFPLSFVAVVAALSPVFISAAPFARRAAAASDILVLKFADVLEQLEGQFYGAALAKFQDADFVAAGFPSSQVPIEQFKVIQQDETTHSTALQGVLKSLNEKPITSCKFSFDAALKDVATMAATARIVELVGVGAYLGAAPLVKDPVLLVAAGSILTVEARHQTVLNILSQNGTAIPSAFDMALTPNEVLALASPFFAGPCDLGVQANPPLTITTNWTLCPGTKLNFSSPALNNTNQDKAFCQMLVGDQPQSIALPLNNCVVPQGVNGPVLIWITSDNQPLLNDVRNRATSQLIAGPAIAFVDTQPQLLGQLARLNPSNPTPVTTTSTTTLSPNQVSSATTPPSTASAPSPSTSSTTSGLSLSTSSTASGLNLSTSSTASGPSPSKIVLVPA